MSRDGSSGTGDIVGKALEAEKALVEKQIVRLERKLRNDPISAIRLRFREGEGFVSDAVDLSGKVLHVEFSLQGGLGQEWSDLWTPSEYDAGETRFEPLGCVVVEWGTAIAFKVSHNVAGTRLRLDWFRKSEPARSSVYVVDPMNNEYLHPIASSMKGEVVAGVPRTGLMVFEPFELPTERFQVHFSGVPTAEAGTAASFSFECADPELSELVGKLNTSPGVREQLTERVDTELQRVRLHLLREQQSGCLGAAVAATSLVGAIGGFLGFWMR